MNRFTTLIKYDYLQRTRSYRFLITLCFSLAFAYSFIPAPDSSYTTIRIGDYLGNYNSAWIAYVSAIMTSVFLSLTGYYLINNSLKNDIDTKLGQIIATTRVSNFSYLLTKVISNFLVLLTIVFIIFVMSILLFFLYSRDARFVLSDFVIAYLLIPVPTMFFISAVAVVLEMFLVGKSILQNTVFFFLFCMMLVGSSNEKQRFPVDLFGKNDVTQEMIQQVKRISATGEDHKLNIGFVVGRQDGVKRFNFEGVNPPLPYMMMRVLLIIIGIGLIAVVSTYFHRFNIREEFRANKIADDTPKNDKVKEVVMTLLPTAKPALGIMPFYKTELLLMIRQGKKWLWGLNLTGMILLAFTPINIAHAIILPMLWFLQVSRWASLTTKEKEHNVHYFAFSSFRPLSRLLTAQLLAGVTISITLALPLLLRHAILLNFNELLAIFLGAIFIVLFSAFLGIISQGKRLFEILFFLITYANINSVPFTDYFGGLSSNKGYLLIMSFIILTMTIMSYSIRKYELSRL